MRMSWLLVLICGLALGGLADAQYILSATLDEDQFVPHQLGPTGSNGSGSFALDSSANTLSFDITAFVFASPEEAAHFHIAPPGQTGPIVFTLPAGTHKVGVWHFPEAAEASILAGQAYVDVHTLEGPGSIRGQITLQAVPAVPPLGMIALVVLAVAGGALLIRRSP
jgi:hypothetical protein